LPQRWEITNLNLIAVSDEVFAKDLARNRLAIVMSRTNHAAYHSGLVNLAK